MSILGLGTSSALAQKPVKSEFPWATSGTLAAGSVCSFDVHVESIWNVTEVDFFDQGGSLTRMNFHSVIQDTYTANGKSLTGMPFTFNAQWLFDRQGNLTNAYTDGVMEKIWLPDGSLFVSAGRVDFVAHGFPDYILSPDKGNPGNIASFCAALTAQPAMRWRP